MANCDKDQRTSFTSTFTWQVHPTQLNPFNGIIRENKRKRNMILFQPYIGWKGYKSNLELKCFQLLHKWYIIDWMYEIRIFVWDYGEFVNRYPSSILCSIHPSQSRCLLSSHCDMNIVWNWPLSSLKFHKPNFIYEHEEFNAGNEFKMKHKWNGWSGYILWSFN